MDEGHSSRTEKAIKRQWLVTLFRPISFFHVWSSVEYLQGTVSFGKDRT